MFWRQILLNLFILCIFESVICIGEDESTKKGLVRRFTTKFKPEQKPKAFRSEKINNFKLIVSQQFAFFKLLEHSLPTSPEIEDGKRWEIEDLPNDKLKPNKQLIFGSVLGKDPYLPESHVPNIQIEMNRAINAVWDSLKASLKEAINIKELDDPNRKLAHKSVNAHIMAEFMTKADKGHLTILIIQKKYNKMQLERGKTPLQILCEEAIALYKEIRKTYLEQTAETSAVILVKQFEHNWLLLPKLNFSITDETSISETQGQKPPINLITKQILQVTFGLTRDEDLTKIIETINVPKETNIDRTSQIIYQRVYSFKAEKPSILDAFLAECDKNDAAKQAIEKFKESINIVTPAPKPKTKKTNQNWRRIRRERKRKLIRVVHRNKMAIENEILKYQAGIAKDEKSKTDEILNSLNLNNLVFKLQIDRMQIELKTMLNELKEQLQQEGDKHKDTPKSEDNDSALHAQISDLTAQIHELSDYVKNEHKGKAEVTQEEDGASVTTGDAESNHQSDSSLIEVVDNAREYETYKAISEKEISLSQLYQNVINAIFLRNWNSADYFRASSNHPDTMREFMINSDDSDDSDDSKDSNGMAYGENHNIKQSP